MARPLPTATLTESVLVLLFAGLVADLLPHDEAYAGIDHGLSLLALLGAAGCLGYLTIRMSLRLGLGSGAPPSASGLPPASAVAGGPEAGEDWPVLVALLLGPLVVLLAGLGGWVEARPAFFVAAR